MKKKLLSMMGLCLLLTGCAAQDPSIISSELSSEVTSETNNSGNMQQIISEQDIHKETILIPGLEQEYDFLFLTDNHIIIPDNRDNTEIQEHTQARYPHFVDENGIPSSESFPLWMEYAVQQEVDGVLLGGDIIDFPSEANISYLEQQLGNLTMPYLYTPGNHDWTYPWDYMTASGEEIYLTKLNPFMDSNPNIHSLELEDLILVAINNSSNQFPSSIMEEYQQILQKGKPVIVLLHVPLLTQSLLSEAREIWETPVVLGGGNYGGIYPDEVSTEFITITTSQNSPVVAVIAGHVHFQNRDMINDNIVQIVGEAGFRRKGTMIHISGK